ncbi:MAG: hypothetical protein HYX71_11960 [Opitutae bacterium]|nr:hypothetical protein [Opitutae bacterium]
MNRKATEPQNNNSQDPATFAPPCLRGENSPLPERHLREPDQGLAEYEADPRAGRPWPEIRDRLLARR